MRGSRLVLSIDFGTTNCKVGLFDENGESLAHAQRACSLESPKLGLYEQDASEWASTLTACIRSLAAGTKSRVATAAVTGQGSTSVCIDSQGKVIGPVISHLDPRTGTPAEAGTGLDNLGYVPSKMAGPLLWASKERPQLLRRVKRVMDVREFIGYLLTGAVTHDSAAFPRPLLDRFSAFFGLRPDAMGVPHGNLEPIGVTTRSCSSKTGLPNGTPVVIAPFDGMCSVVGAGVDRKGLAADIAGSTEVVAVPVEKGSRFEVIPHVFRDLSLFYASPPLGHLVQWFKDEFYGPTKGGFEKMDRDAARSTLGAGGVMCVPKVEYDRFSPRFALNFLNLTSSSSKREMSRAVMEGLAFYVSKTVSGLVSAGVHVGEVRLGGGGASNRLWNQIRADVYGVEVALPQTLDVGCLGSAIFGSVSAGLHRSVEEATEMMVKVTRRYSPDPARHRKYAELQERFL